MRRLGACAIVLLFCSLSVCARAQSVYDDFGTKFIDPDKWIVSQDCGDVSRAYRECVLEIKGGMLRQENRVYGDTDSNSGFNFSGVFLNFANPSAIATIKADVVVKNVEVGGCANNPNVTGQTRARLGGVFFNTGSNDVRATINLERFPDTPKNRLRIDAFTDGVAGFISLGTIGKGETVSLTISWEQANHRFKFVVSRPGAADLVAFISYTESDSAAPDSDVKGLSVSNLAPNCIATPRPVAYMEAFFDNVNVAP